MFRSLIRTKSVKLRSFVVKMLRISNPSGFSRENNVCVDVQHAVHMNTTKALTRRSDPPPTPTPSHHYHPSLRLSQESNPGRWVYSQLSRSVKPATSPRVLYSSYQLDFYPTSSSQTCRNLIQQKRQPGRE